MTEGFQQAGGDGTTRSSSPRGGTDHDLISRFRAIWQDRGDPDTAAAELLPVRLARACASVLEVDAAGLSVMDGDFRVPLGASDELAGVAERLQFTQGEGPCLDAARQGRTLAVDARQIDQRWPLFGAELFARTPYVAIITIPLCVAASTKGAIDIFLTDSRALRSVALADAAAVAEAVVEALELNADAGAPGDVQEWSDEPIASWLTGPSAQHRRFVWLAVGMMMARYDISSVDALTILRSYAYGHDTVLDQVALDLVEGRLDIEQLQS